MLRFLKGVLMVLALLNSLTLVMNGAAMIRAIETQGSVRAFVFLAMQFCSVILFWAAVSGISARKSYGRWLGVASFLYLAGNGVWGLIFLYSQDLGSQYLTTNQTAMIVACQVSLFILASGFLTLSSKVDAYFNPDKCRISGDTPPPPLFDS